MRVFVTGATGFIGSAVVRELMDAGHEVTGLARSDASAAALEAAGAGVHRGDLDDPDGLARAAAAADGVVHTAFHHDFSDFASAVAIERRVIAAIGDALAGSGKPFVMTSGTGGLTPGRVATEESTPDPDSFAAVRHAAERDALALAARDVRVSALRLPSSVHGRGDRGFVSWLIAAARDKGVSAYPGDGSNRWAAVHRLDAARLYRLALESAQAGTVLHGVGEEGVPVRDIAGAIGRGLGLPVTSLPPEDAVGHFGFVGGVFSLDIPASSDLTRKRLDWHPVEQGLIADLEEGHYFGA
ncbi:SDR family oxidoreductase [Actinomadura montaniterrae]|uniref:SDR family oxidoreductase n=1 Tax=Actinomadura montaniterrae TaxID=1803903 RepID=A0A6L3VS06_9ACTN|nr:SDR family oxidoreductase [Actinomadura montaniterrae]KAB2373338.1 SDR family oxidoreductase [Actinomadura montaniterrae]